MKIADERGFALVLALAVIVLLCSLMVDFSYTMMVDMTLAANVRDEYKALYAARSGIELTRHRLQQDDPAYDALDEEWALLEGHPGFFVADDEGRFKGTIEDEASKIALNRIGDKGVSYQQLRRLLDVLELDPHLIDPVCDWVDTNNTPEPFGAEASYYESLSPPYPCKNGPLTTIEELLLVKGMTVEDLYGTEEKKGLIRYLSVYDAEEGKVNINTAPAEVLQSLSDAIDWGQAEAIIAYRQEQPFKSKADLRRVPGMEAIYAAIEKDITCQSSTFSLRVEGRVREIKKVIFAVLKRDTGKAVKPIFWRVE